MDAGLQAKILEDDFSRALKKRDFKAVGIISVAKVGGPYDQLFQQGRYQEAMYAVNEGIAEVKQMLKESPQSIESAAFAYALLYRARSLIRQNMAEEIEPVVFFMEMLIDFDTILQISNVPQLVAEIQDIQRIAVEEFLRLLKRELPNSERLQHDLLAEPGKTAREMYATFQSESPDMYLPVDPYYTVSSKPIPTASADDKPTYQASSKPVAAASHDDKPAKKGCLAGLFGMFF